MTETLTIEHLRHVLDTRCGGVLHAGTHQPPDDPDAPCEVCLEEFRALALGLPWTDEPEGGTPTERACQILNDASWSTREVATDACLPLALLSERDAAEGWIERYAERTIREVLPIALRAVGLDVAAERCEREGTAEAAEAAAEAAARATAKVARRATRAARAARERAARAAAKWAVGARAAVAEAAWAAARAAEATEATAWAAEAMAWAAWAAWAAGDDVLRLSVRILIECHRGEGL